MAIQMGGISGRLTKSWLPFRVLYQDNADRQAGSSFVDTLVNGPARGATAMPYRGGVALPDGRAILVPSTSPTIGIFDPIAGTITAGPAHGEGNRAFRGAVMMTNGLILMIPDFAAAFLIYDPARNTFAKVAHGQTAPTSTRAHFYGGVMGADDAVYMFHTGLLRMVRFDPVSQTSAVVGDAITVDSAATAVPFHAAVIVPDKRIILMPRANSRPQAFDTSTLAFTPLTPHGMSAGNVINSAALGHDGLVYASHASTGQQRTYNPVTDTWAALPGAAWITSSSFSTVLNLRSGKIAFMPKNGQFIGIWDTTTTTWQQGASVAASAGTANHDGGLMLADGRVLILADAATEHKLWTPYTGGTPLPYDYIASRYIGNRG